MTAIDVASVPFIRLLEFRADELGVPVHPRRGPCAACRNRPTAEVVCYSTTRLVHELAGVASERRVRGWGHRGQIGFYDADRIAVAFGVTVHDIW